MKLSFKLPAGVDVPDGKQPGDTFQAMATFKLGSGSDVDLMEVDGESISGKDSGDDQTNMEADDDTTESGQPNLRDRIMSSMANPTPGS